MTKSKAIPLDPLPVEDNYETPTQSVVNGQPLGPPPGHGGRPQVGEEG